MRSPSSVLILIFCIVLRSPDVFSVLRDRFFLNFDHCPFSSLSALDLFLNMTDTSRSFYRSIRKNNISDVDHRQVVSWLNSIRTASWLICRDIFCCLRHLYLDHRILNWCTDLVLSLLFNRILISNLILATCEARLQDTLKMSSQRNSSSLLSRKGTYLTTCPWSNFCRWHFFIN